jgi:hypothetical protein
MLATSLAVVRKMLEAVAGSAPSRFSTIGISAPAIPDTVQAMTIARKTTEARIIGFASPCIVE